MTEKTDLEEDEENLTFKNDKKLRRERASTQALINTANIIDQADAQVLSSMYDPIATSLSLTDSTSLGAITTARALLQAVSSPIWGWLSDKFSRKFILSIGCFVWGAFTIILAFLNSYWGMFFVRAFTGLGLAVIVPTTQSLIADYFPQAKRGKAFGVLGLTTVLGAIVGTLYATILGDMTILGFDGWRFVFVSLGIFSIILGVFVVIFAKDPARGLSEEDFDKLKQEKEEEKRTVKLADYGKILSNKTFMLIVAQGIAGSIPWNSILFMILWLETMGVEPFMAGIAFAVVAIGAAFGNLFGGFIGDRAEKWNPNKGRILMAQISVFSGIPMMLILFWIIPDYLIIPNYLELGLQLPTNMLYLFIAIGIFTGFMISWSAPATNNPIFSELFEPEIRGTAFSVDRLFEGSIAATGTLIVGLIADHAFGYDKTLKVTPAGVVNNVQALGYAMLISTVIPWTICLICYSFIYWTYPKDRDIAKQKMLERTARIQNKEITTDKTKIEKVKDETEDIEGG